MGGKRWMGEEGKGNGKGKKYARKTNKGNNKMPRWGIVGQGLTYNGDSHEKEAQVYNDIPTGIPWVCRNMFNCFLWVSVGRDSRRWLLH